MARNFLPPDSQPWVRELEGKLNRVSSALESIQKTVSANANAGKARKPASSLTLETPPVPGEGPLGGDSVRAVGGQISFEDRRYVYKWAYSHNFHGLTMGYYVVFTATAIAEKQTVGELSVSAFESKITMLDENVMFPSGESPVRYSIRIPVPISPDSPDHDKPSAPKLLKAQDTINIVSPVELQDIKFEVRSDMRSRITINTESGIPSITGTTANGSIIDFLNNGTLGKSTWTPEEQEKIDNLTKEIANAHNNIEKAEQTLNNNLSDLERKLSEGDEVARNQAQQAYDLAQKHNAMVRDAQRAASEAEANAREFTESYVRNNSGNTIIRTKKSFLDWDAEPGKKVGDIWLQVDSDGEQIEKQAIWGGSAWKQVKLDMDMLRDFDDRVRDEVNDNLGERLTDFRGEMEHYTRTYVSANGGINITQSTKKPDSAVKGKKKGDIWWQLFDKGSEQVTGQWVWDGEKWVPKLISSEVIAHLDVSKLTANYGSMRRAVIDRIYSDVITAKLLTAREVITENMIATGSVTADKIKALSISGKHIVGNSITGDKLKAKSITSRELLVDRALVNELIASKLVSGIVESNVFKTQGSFKKDGVSINSSGWRIGLDGKGSINANTEYGLFANNENGKTTFWIKKDGSAMFSGDITSGSTIRGASIIGPTLKTSNSGMRLEIVGNRIATYNSSNDLTSNLDSNGLTFFRDNEHASIGKIGLTQWANNPSKKGLAFNLDQYGDFMSWAHRNYGTGPFEIKMALDMSGSIYGPRGGFRLEVPISIGDDSTDNYWQRIRFTLQKLGSWSYPAIVQDQGRAGIAFGTDDMYIIVRNTYFSVIQLLQKVGYNI